MLKAFDQGVDSDGKVFPAGWVSVRVTGQTGALLGMQQFEPTGFVEVSLIGTPDDYDVMQLVERLARERGGTLHWGQSNGLLQPTDLEFYYGRAQLDQWKAVQAKLGGKTFTNTFMRRCGLSGD
jgi:hypothetical protein